MTLTVAQMRLIAALPADPGFILLLDSLQADLDDIGDYMAREVDDPKLLALAHRWQALKNVLDALKNRPENVREELSGTEETPEELKPPPVPKTKRTAPVL